MKSMHSGSKNFGERFPCNGKNAMANIIKVSKNVEITNELMATV